nr:VTT domain-containing protein [Pseudonocardia sp. C8]
MVTAILQSAWLLPALVLMIAVDGPVPMLPSETLLMSSVASASVARNLPMLAGLFFASAAGSMAGDLAVHALGRGSHRLLPRSAQAEHGVARWIRSNLFRRPVTALAAARFLPGGRLVSCAAAGRLGLGLGSFVAGSAVSSTLWACYMLGIGLALGPVTGGNPLLCVLAGAVLAVLTAGAFAIARRVRAARRPAPAPAPAPALAAN